MTQAVGTRARRSAGPLLWSRIPHGALTLRFQVLRGDGFHYTYRGRPSTIRRGEPHLDHVVPCSVGGKTRIENLRAACAECNPGKVATRL